MNFKLQTRVCFYNNTCLLFLLKTKSLLNNLTSSLITRAISYFKNYMRNFFEYQINDFYGPYRSIKSVDNYRQLYPRLHYILKVRYRKKFDIRHKMIHNLNIDIFKF